jgi:AraC-like DNA-binding protein
MAQAETFSTAGIEPRRKLDFWNDLASNSFSPLTAEPADPLTFSGWLTRAAVENFLLAEVYSDAQRVRHSRAHVARTRQAMFFLHMQLDGESVTRQDGREAHLQPGDFTLADNSRPYEIAFAGPNRMFVLGIPVTQMRRHLACAESVVAIPMSACAGLNCLVSNFMRDFWTQCRSDLQPDVAPRVTHAILDLVASAYAVAMQNPSDRSSLATAHRIRIVNYIEAHLGDPDLTPLQVARACRITTRYLHHLFSDDDETIAKYILRRRLEQCSHALGDPAQRSRTVTAIAFDYGFNSPTHFGRVFRARYGATPREYRHKTLTNFVTRQASSPSTPISLP